MLIVEAAVTDAAVGNVPADQPDADNTEPAVIISTSLETVAVVITLTVVGLSCGNVPTPVICENVTLFKVTSCVLCIPVGYVYVCALMPFHVGATLVAVASKTWLAAVALTELYALVLEP